MRCGSATTRRRCASSAPRTGCASWRPPGARKRQAARRLTPSAESDASVGVDRGEGYGDADGLELERSVADQILNFPLGAATTPDLDVALFAGHERDLLHRFDSAIVIELATPVMIRRRGRKHLDDDGGAR